MRVRFQALANDLAVNFYPAIIIAVACVLLQVRNCRGRARFAVFGQMFLVFPIAGISARSGNTNGSEDLRREISFKSFDIN
jgi:hypothetical protein